MNCSALTEVYAVIVAMIIMQSFTWSKLRQRDNHIFLDNSTHSKLWILFIKTNVDAFNGVI